MRLKMLTSQIKTFVGLSDIIIPSLNLIQLQEKPLGFYSMEHLNYIFNIGTCLVCHKFFLKVQWGQIYLYTSFVIQFYVRCVAYFWSEIFFFGCESITGRYFVSSFFVLEVHFILQNITFKFQHYFMVVIFLINRGCDNHIIIILVNYFAVKNNC